MNTRAVCGMLLSLALSRTAWCEDPAPAADAPAAQQPSGATASQASAPAPSAQDADRSAAGSSGDDRFKPSEKISEDLSVSFPADI